MNFTQMPVSQWYKYLLVMIDTFTGQIVVFPTQTKKAEEVVKNKQTNKKTNKKTLLREVIPRFGLPRSLQSDNGTSFTSKVTRGVSKALGITSYLHCCRFLLQGNLPNPGMEPASPVLPALAGGFFTTEPPGKPPYRLSLQDNWCLSRPPNSSTRTIYPFSSYLIICNSGQWRHQK